MLYRVNFLGLANSQIIYFDRILRVRESEIILAMSAKVGCLPIETAIASFPNRV